MSKQTAEQHSGELILYFTQMSQRKYAAGVKEHGEGLWNLTDDQLIEAAFEEVLDLSNYLGTLIQNRKLRGKDSV